MGSTRPLAGQLIRFRFSLSLSLTRALEAQRAVCICIYARELPAAAAASDGLLGTTHQRLYYCTHAHGANDDEDNELDVLHSLAFLARSYFFVVVVVYQNKL